MHDLCTVPLNVSVLFGLNAHHRLLRSVLQGRCVPALGRRLGAPLPGLAGPGAARHCGGVRRQSARCPSGPGPPALGSARNVPVPGAGPRNPRNLARRLRARGVCPASDGHGLAAPACDPSIPVVLDPAAGCPRRLS